MKMHFPSFITIATLLIASAITVSAQDTGKSTGIIFSPTTVVLLGVILLMVFVIFYLSRIIRNLSDQLMDFYSSDRAFFKK